MGTHVGHGFKFSWDVGVGSHVGRRRTHVGFTIFGGSEKNFLKHISDPKKLLFQKFLDYET